MARRRVNIPSDEERTRLNPTEWGDFKKGDPVTVDNEPGVFRFMYVTLKADETPDTITVYGGYKGREKMRTFVPERVTPGRKVIPRSRRRRKTEE